jgi:hypothetical protein
MIISTLIGDEDSSVQKHLRDLEDVIGPIEKLSDFTHIKRNFGSQLYGLHASFKGIKMERGKAFNPDKIKRIQSAFRMAVKQNVGDWEGLQRNLRTIVPHYYGEHTHCGEWCKGRGNPQWQSILNHTGLRSQLNSIIETFACDVNARKIAHMSSSQRNETFNSVLRHYSPKDTNKGRSVAYTSCVDLAIIHFNEGSSAAYKMIAERCQVPLSQQFVDRLARTTGYHATYKSSEKRKRRRAELKGQKTSQKKRRVMGPSYSTGMGIADGFRESQRLKRPTTRIVLAHQSSREAIKRRAVVRIKLASHVIKL